MGKFHETGMRAVETGWQDIILVCSRCGHSGFGEDGEQSLRRALKQALREQGLRGRAGIVDVECLGVCPKRAVTVARAGAPGRFMVVPHGTAAELVLARLDIHAAPQEDSSERNLPEVPHELD